MFVPLLKHHAIQLMTFFLTQNAEEGYHPFRRMEQMLTASSVDVFNIQLQIHLPQRRRRMGYFSLNLWKTGYSPLSALNKLYCLKHQEFGT